MAIPASMTDLLGRQQSTYSDILEYAAEMRPKFDAVDRSSPNALADLQKLNSEYLIEITKFNATKNTYYSEFLAIHNTLSEPDKSEVNELWVQSLSDNNIALDQINDWRRPTISDIAALKDKADKNPNPPDTKTEESTKNNKPSDDDKAKPATAQTNATRDEGNVTITDQRPIKPDLMGQGDIIPGKRTYNPLSQLSSYNYNLSLYMLTPDAFNAFELRGRKELNLKSSLTGESGVYLVAQSAGKPQNTSSTSEFENDIYIDNLQFESGLGMVNMRAATHSIKTINFDIIEPYGTSFPRRLALAQLNLKKHYKGNLNYGNIATAPMRQCFMLVISFYGYDARGKLVTANDYSKIDTGKEAEGFSIFDKYIGIMVGDMNYKLDGKTTTYHINASEYSASIGYGLRWGRVGSNYTIPASTVGGTLNDLMKKLSEEEVERNKLAKAGQMEKTTYEIIFDSKKIEEAAVIDKDQFRSKNTSGDSGVKKTQDSTESSSEKSLPDSNLRKISFARDTSIIQAIQNTIARSEYVSKALKSLNTDDIKAEDSKNSEIKKTQADTLTWFSIIPKITINGRDEVRNDWTYNIKYHVREYDIPYIVSPFNELVKNAIGIFKDYEYWYTGKNSEIISFEHDIKFGFTNAILYTKDQVADSNKQDIPRHFIRSNGDTSIAVDKTSQAIDIIQASLYAPGNFTTVKITIMGDPDFIPTSAEYTLAPQYAKDPYMINPTTSQVFCRLKFNTVDDYSLSNGLMKPNPIEFFTEKVTPGDKRGDDILWLRIDSANNTFSGGRFTQTLNATQVKLDFKNKNNSKISNNAAEDNRQNDSDNTTVTPPTQNTVVNPIPKPITKKDDDALPNINYSNEGRNSVRINTAAPATVEQRLENNQKLVNADNRVPVDPKTLLPLKR